MSTSITESANVQGVVFACAYIKRELINRIGFLDSDYFSSLRIPITA